MNMMEEMKWKQEQKAKGETTSPPGESKPKPPPPAAKKISEEKKEEEAKPKVASSLASRQAMLAGIMGGGVSKNRVCFVF